MTVAIGSRASASLSSSDSQGQIRNLDAWGIDTGSVCCGDLLGLPSCVRCDGKSSFAHSDIQC
jgi:hypothetical protein